MFLVALTKDNKKRNTHLGPVIMKYVTAADGSDGSADTLTETLPRLQHLGTLMQFSKIFAVY